MSREANTQRAKVGTLVCDDDDDNGDAIISSRGEQRTSDYNISAFSIITLVCGTDASRRGRNEYSLWWKDKFIAERERERAEIFKKNINLSTSFLKIQI